MPHVPILPADKAPKDVNAVYEEFYRRMSFPSAPNFITTQGHSATVVRGTWEAVKGALVTGALPRWQKEMMFVANDIPDPKLRDMIKFALNCSRHPQALTDNDHEILRQLQNRMPPK
jgi:hypothetical protein